MVTQAHKQLSVLVASTAAFTICFAVWMMFAVIGIPLNSRSASTKPSSDCWSPCPC